MVYITKTTLQEHHELRKVGFIQSHTKNIAKTQYSRLTIAFTHFTYVLKPTIQLSCTKPGVFQLTCDPLSTEQSQQP